MLRTYPKALQSYSDAQLKCGFECFCASARTTLEGDGKKKLAVPLKF